MQIGIQAHKHPVPCHLGILRGHKDLSCIMQLYTRSYHLLNRAGFGRGHPEDVRPELLETSEDMRLEAELWQHWSISSGGAGGGEARRDQKGRRLATG